MNNLKRINVLIVEDEPTIAQMLREYLESVSSVKGPYSFHCVVVGAAKGGNLEGGNEGIYAFKNPEQYIKEEEGYDASYFDKHADMRFHLVLLDIMLSSKDGYQVLQEIREIDSQVPIVLLSAKNVREDREKGFRLGADDYMSKPYSFQELDHRIKNILRRTEAAHANAIQNAAHRDSKTDKLFNIGGYMFDYITRTIVKTSGEEVRLSFKENELLYMLCKGSGDSSILGEEAAYSRGIVERNHILNKIWRDNSYYKSRSMDVYMSKLRKIFQDNPKVEIVTLHGAGYRIVVHDDERAKARKQPLKSRERSLNAPANNTKDKNPYLDVDFYNSSDSFASEPVFDPNFSDGMWEPKSNKKTEPKTLEDLED